MARQKASNKYMLIIAALLVAAYAIKQCETRKEQQTAQQTEQTESTASDEVQTDDESTSQSAQEENSSTSTSKTVRAKGIEIPAYLTDRPEEIVQHEGFTLSYNNKHLVPNWVAWVLTKERTKGNQKRSDEFLPDETIKKGPIAYDDDYRGSGYDRGHMCPAADNKNDHDAMIQCFYFSNMCPQLHALNAGDWEELESICRKWAVAYDSIFIVCGPIIEKGKKYETIGENKVMVPRQFFKVILRMDGANKAEAIGFIFNNDNVQHPLADYAMSVDSVEARTGINFFSKLPKEVERAAEAKFDVSKWKNLTQKRHKAKLS